MSCCEGRRSDVLHIYIIIIIITIVISMQGDASQFCVLLWRYVSDLVVQSSSAVMLRRFYPRDKGVRGSGLLGPLIL
jgi:hypothetical protein